MQNELFLREYYPLYFWSPFWVSPLKIGILDPSEVHFQENWTPYKNRGLNSDNLPFAREYTQMSVMTNSCKVITILPLARWNEWINNRLLKNTAIYSPNSSQSLCPQKVIVTLKHNVLPSARMFMGAMVVSNEMCPFISSNNRNTYLLKIRTLDALGKHQQRNNLNARRDADFHFDWPNKAGDQYICFQKCLLVYMIFFYFYETCDIKV